MKKSRSWFRKAWWRLQAPFQRQIRRFRSASIESGVGVNAKEEFGTWVKWRTRLCQFTTSFQSSSLTCSTTTVGMSLTAYPVAAELLTWPVPNCGPSKAQERSVNEWSVVKMHLSTMYTEAPSRSGPRSVSVNCVVNIMRRFSASAVKIGSAPKRPSVLTVQLLSRW